MSEITVMELAETIGGIVHGPQDLVITGVASVAEASPGDIVLAENPRYLDAAAKSRACAVVCAQTSCGSKSVITVSDPRRAFAQILKVFELEKKLPKLGIDPGSRVSESAVLGEGVSIGFGAYIGDEAIIGAETVIYPLTYVGNNVQIGSECILYPNVTIYDGSEIGNRVILHSGAVIGSDGFGYIPIGDEVFKIPHIGKVILEDDVEIGANVTIDRAKTGATRVGCGTKIDNLVQLGHNVKIGKKCIIVAQAGFAGSSEAGDGVTVAGQVGVNDHIKIGDGAIIAGQSGIFNNLPGGCVYSGHPARPHKETLKSQAIIQHLPELKKTVDSLKKEVERMKRRLAQLGGDEVAVESR